ncbi:DUF4183 domain-containing protein [Paenibacillus sp. P96]|uniref:DUF4183 domain-containing protein n=1 Tax=Paenibacillus zeirhizosphaerae TaxID=2987519 RepID=A0ABT9FLV8_9BACL|nr:DUF4183 domain-containing protein [Paenibacillus sp. P96]
MGATGPTGDIGPIGPTGPTGPSITSISIIPTATRYSLIPPSDASLSVPVTYAATQFIDDSGNLAATFSGLGPNSYNNLFINGILQEGSFYNVTSSALTLNNGGGTLYAGTPITLVIVNFTALIT